MPTYNYKCNNCDFTFTVLQSMNAEPLQKCIDCGGIIRRVISGGTGMIFKGSGFYLTDYGKSNKQDLKKEKNTQGSANTERIEE